MTSLPPELLVDIFLRCGWRMVRKPLHLVHPYWHAVLECHKEHFKKKLLVHKSDPNSSRGAWMNRFLKSWTEDETGLRQGRAVWTNETGSIFIDLYYRDGFQHQEQTITSPTRVCGVVSSSMYFYDGQYVEGKVYCDNKSKNSWK